MNERGVALDEIFFVFNLKNDEQLQIRSALVTTALEHAVLWKP